jgi:hypothetical protein
MKHKIESRSPLQSHSGRVMTKTGNIHRTTPEWILKLVRKVFGGTIGLDPCPNPDDVVGAENRYLLPKKAFRYMAEIDEARKALVEARKLGDAPALGELKGLLKARQERLRGLLEAPETQNGLRLTWRGFGGVYMNPPYGRDLPNWLRKMGSEFTCLPDSRGDDQLITLLPAETGAVWCQDLLVPAMDSVVLLRGRLTFGPGTTPAPFWSMVGYAGDHKEKFLKVFEKHGWRVK